MLVSRKVDTLGAVRLGRGDNVGEVFTSLVEIGVSFLRLGGVVPFVEMLKIFVLGTSKMLHALRSTSKKIDKKYCLLRIAICFFIRSG